MVALHRWRLLSSFTQVPILSKKCQRNPALQIQVPSLPSAQKLHMRDRLQMISTCTCWHSSFLIKTSSSAPWLWHSAYAAHSGIQTTAMISVSQLPFAEGSRILMPAENVVGEGRYFSQRPDGDGLPPWCCVFSHTGRIFLSCWKRGSHPASALMMCNYHRYKPSTHLG